MPGKSRKKRGKYTPPAPKKKNRPGRLVTAVQQPVVAQSQQPVDSPGMPPPPTEVPTPVVKPMSTEYPFLTAELRTIGLLAVIMLAILVLLVIFLP